MKMRYPKVLAITKRTAELCGTQTQLHLNGFELITATSIAMAGVILRSTTVKGVIVCKHSWSEAERKQIVDEVSACRPGTAIIMQCMGCTGCDELAHIAGALDEPDSLLRFIDTVRYPLA